MLVQIPKNWSYFDRFRAGSENAENSKHAFVAGAWDVDSSRQNQVSTPWLTLSLGWRAYLSIAFMRE